MAIQVDSNDLKSALLLAAVAAGGRGAPGIAGGAARGGFGGTAGILSGVGGIRRTAPITSMYEASEYPKKFTPEKYHYYDVELSPFVPVGTNMSADHDLIKKAGRMQTLDEHNEALTKFLRPGMTEPEAHVALMEGIEAEKKLPQFWDESNAEGTDRAKFTVRSSAVSGIRITPDGMVQVKWAKPSKKNPSGWYNFKQFQNTHEASLAAQKLLNEDSIGRAVYPILTNPLKLKFKKKSKANGPLGTWNKEYFNSAFSPEA